MRTARLMLDGIEVGAHRRPVDPQHVERLKASIREIGLQTPITVMSRAEGPDTRMILVAGAHRLEALRQLGDDAAECFVIDEDDDLAELWEIDENFARTELTDAQRADHHARREAILIRRGDVLAGRGHPKNSDKLSEKTSYARRAANELGVDERTVRRDLRRAKCIDAGLLAEVTGTALDKGVVLDELAATPRDEQRAKLSEIASRGLRPVSPAPDPLNDAEAVERQLAALMSAWNRAGPDARQRFLDQVDTPVFDRRRA